MGRSRRKYKPKPNVTTDDTEIKKIKLDFDVGQGKYDASNPLVLPSKKRATKIRDKTAPPVKLLSKRKRKVLEKIVDKKKKKENRVSLLEALEQVKADPKDLELLTQLQSTQTLGRKRYTDENLSVLSKSEVQKNQGRILSSIKGIKRKHPQRNEDESLNGDPNIVRLGVVSSDESESETSETNEEEDEEDDGKDEEEEADVNDEDLASSADDVECLEDKEEKIEGTTSDADNKLVKEETTVPESKDKPATPKAPIQPVKFVIVNRSEEVQKGRLKLPILSEEQSIMEAINEHSVTVVVGSTGSGKTTQVPQFLYEAGYASSGQMIGITEPRRVAAIAMSQRVCYEMNLTSKQVSYQIRFQGNTTPDTKLKFMTDGVLLKEIQLDPTLKKYSVIIIDEAHERSIFSDILIGILSRIIPVRLAKKKPLKLVIMSATLRVEDFTENPRLFNNPAPPVLRVEARMFDVTIHHNKRTVDDYVQEAYKKVCKIHRQLPDGGILVFLTGQLEVNQLMSKLRRTFPYYRKGDNSEDIKMSAFKKRRHELNEKKKAERDEPLLKKIVLPEVKLEDFKPGFVDDIEEDVSTVDKLGGDSLELDEDDSDDPMSHGLLTSSEKEQPLFVLPLYSLLPPDKQQLVFQPPPEGTRLCVVATNVAETSLTIPNVKYVIDSGKVKKKIYDKVTGVSMFQIMWTSQASANQRAGRAGRTAPGHCYRLYSSAVFEHEFEKFSPAEIQLRPIDDIVLIMKSMKLPVMNFPFPTPPDYIQIRSGIKRLKILGALEDRDSENFTPHILKKMKRENKDLSVITPLGKAMAAFPLAPRYGKMLALSHQHSLLSYSIALVAALTIPEVMLETPIETKNIVEDFQRRWQNLRLSWAGKGNSRKLGDMMVLLRCVGSAEYQGSDISWCEKNGLRHKAVLEIRKLRRQLTNEVNLIIPSCNAILDPKMPPPTDDQANLLRQIITAGLIDHVAYRVNEWELKDPADKIKWKHAYRTQEMEEPAFLPTSSVVRIDMPQWLVYQDIYETNRMYMRNVCVIEPQWLAIFAPHLCTFSAPIETQEPRYDAEMDKVLCHRSAKFGPSGWEMPDVEVEYPHCRDLFRWFAYFFLCGEICTPLKDYTSHIYEPKVMVSPVAIRFREQRENLLIKLMSRDITNLAKLKDIWSSDPTYLQNEYLQWIEDEEIRSHVKKIWPPIAKEEEDVMRC